MKLAFHDVGTLDYSPQTPFDGPLGGTESATAYLTAALAQRGHEITLINKNSRPGLCRGVRATGMPPMSAGDWNAFDAIISINKPRAAVFRRMGVEIPIVNWQHLTASNNANRNFADRDEISAYDSFIFVSDFQRNEFVSKYDVDGHIIRNAASPGALQVPFEEDCFLDRGEDPVLVYASSPGRGLDFAMIAFAEIRKSLPKARLLVCSDNNIYQDNQDGSKFSAIFALAEMLPGVEFVGSLSQVELGKQFSKADILAYPTTFVETSCIVVMEALANGCHLVATDKGALRETASGLGTFLPYEDSRFYVTSRFAQIVVEMVAQARGRPAIFKQNRKAHALWLRETHSWERRAQEWETWLEEFLRGRRRIAG